MSDLNKIRRAQIAAAERAVIDSLPPELPSIADAQPSAEPVAWMWQHDETGRVGFVERWRVENGWVFLNPLCKLTRPLYTAPQPSAEPRYTLQQIADACMYAEIPDSKFESVTIALQDAQPSAEAAEKRDCPHAAPFRYCQQCPVRPCPIGLGDRDD